MGFFLDPNDSTSVTTGEHSKKRSNKGLREMIFQINIDDVVPARAFCTVDKILVYFLEPTLTTYTPPKGPLV